MDDIREKFLWDLGIREGKYPKSFLDKIQNINTMLTNTEIGYCAVSSRCNGHPGIFCIKDVVGTDHARYAGKTWIEAFLDLDRGADIINLYEGNPNYYEEIKSIGNSDMGLLKYADKYYIFSKAGGGNNRIITMKIRYLSLIHQAGNNQDEIEKINNQFTFSANIRELPRDNTIPFIVVAMDEDLSGLAVKKKGEQFTVTKKFTDLELFKGSGEELKEYFKSLFNADIYGKDEVRARLKMLETGCHLSPGKYRRALENLLPQFKAFHQLESER